MMLADKLYLVEKYMILENTSVYLWWKLSPVAMGGHFINLFLLRNTQICRVCADQTKRIRYVCK